MGVETNKLYKYFLHFFIEILNLEWEENWMLENKTVRAVKF